MLDVVAGPYYYLGPAYTSRREIVCRADRAIPSDQFPRAGFHFVFDFTGDGWPDVVAGENRPLFLYVNPKGERRRWAKYPAVPQGNSELVLMRDLDGDGKPEAIFGTGTGTAKRNACVRAARSGRSDRAVGGAHDLRAGTGVRPQPRSGRCERRRAR